MLVILFERRCKSTAFFGHTQILDLGKSWENAFSHTDFANKFAYIAKKPFLCGGFDFLKKERLGRDKGLFYLEGVGIRG